MEEIRDVLHLDAMTVTGKTLGENLDELKANGFYEHCQQLLDEANARCGIKLTRADIIRPASDPIGTDGSIAILKGNLAPEGAVIKHTACPREMFQAVLRARPFDSEEECLDAVLHHKVEKGDAVFIRYEGPQAAACRRCSIPVRPSARTRSWAAASPSSRMAASPAHPPAPSSATAALRPRPAAPSLWWKRATLSRSTSPPAS